MILLRPSLQVAEARTSNAEVLISRSKLQHSSDRDVRYLHDAYAMKEEETLQESVSHLLL
jgi:hypothetical protein